MPLVWENFICRQYLDSLSKTFDEIGGDKMSCILSVSAFSGSLHFSKPVRDVDKNLDYKVHLKGMVDQWVSM